MDITYALPSFYQCIEFREYEKAIRVNTELCSCSFPMRYARVVFLFSSPLNSKNDHNYGKYGPGKQTAVFIVLFNIHLCIK